jgi:hypothetical protein
MMPLEGHWQRLNTPLRETTSRERRILWVLSALLAAAIAVAVVVFVSNGSSSPATPAGCIRIEVGSTMGGGTTQLCGQTAARFCHSPAAHDEQDYLAKCRDAGYAVRPQ